jgi:hypothetical protein
MPIAARDSDPDVDTMPTGSLRRAPAASPARPFWSRALNRRPTRPDDSETD